MAIKIGGHLLKQNQQLKKPFFNLIEQTLNNNLIAKKVINQPWKIPFFMEQEKTIKGTKTTDVFVIRHAESEFNKAQFDFGGEKAATTAKFESLDIKFDPKLLDCSLTQQGILQCQATKLALQNEDIKLVVVSPLRRTLQTCEEIFKDHPNKPKVVVDPLFREHVQSACDVGSKIMESKEMFSHYDFSFIKNFKYPSLWSLTDLYDSELKQQALEFVTKECNSDPKIINEKGAEVFLSFLKMNYPAVLDTKKDTIRRSLLQKERIEQYKIKFGLNDIQEGKMAVVAHRQILSAFTAEKVDIEKEEIINGIRLKNGEYHQMKF